jgi:hypothetical protein
MTHCTDLTHARMKADPLLFLSCVAIGFNTFNGVRVSMVRNCRRCGTSLCMSMARLIELYPLVQHAVEVES